MVYDFKYFENSLGRIYCTIRYRPGSKRVALTWKGTAPVASLKEVKNSILELLEKNTCHSILNDVQDFFSAPTEVLAELTEVEWDKEVSRMGVKYIANVLKSDTEMPEPDQIHRDGLHINFFSHKLDAVNWLNQQATG